MIEGTQTVLIVEDDEEMRSLIVEFLRDEFRTLVACSADEGVTVARTERPALVLCDLNMPGRNGLHTIEALRSDPATVDTPIILMSGQAAPAEAARYSIRFLPKPFSFNSLVEVVRGMVAAGTARIPDPRPAGARIN